MSAILVPKGKKLFDLVVLLFHLEVNSVFLPAGGQRSSLGLISSMPNVCLTDVLCRMFEKCSGGGGQRLFWPHFESIALHWCV